MAWTETSVGVNNDRTRNSENVAMSSGGAATTYSSTIDFIKKDKDFLVWGNTALVNTVAAVTGEVQVSFDGVTFITITSGLLTTMDTLLKVGLYDASASGDAPYYRIALICAGDEVGVTIAVEVIS